MSRLKLKTLTIKRSGEVRWLVKGDHHCGPESEVTWTTGYGSFVKPLPRGLMVQYAVVVVCEPSLDTRGFLFDQVTMADYMAALAAKPTNKSCERLADYAARYLMKQLKHDAPTCLVRHLSLTLSPAPFVAEVTACYGANDGE